MEKERKIFEAVAIGEKISVAIDGGLKDLVRATAQIIYITVKTYAEDANVNFNSVLSTVKREINANINLFIEENKNEKERKR